MSVAGAGSSPKYKLCPTCRHIYPATNNFCPQDQTALTVSDDIIAGRYILGQMVGAGAMGKVYMAEDTQLGRRVALKLLNAAQDARVRIDREAKAVGALDHDNVVRVYERGQHDDGRQYIAMEYLEGESLRSYLATQGRLPVRRAMELWLQAVRGVAAAHKKNVVHRDLKPDNLFLARREHDDEKIEQLKVLDFGIAQIRNEPATRGTVRVGTPGYVAPEQWMRGEATARSDVWSLGVILLEMLTALRSLGANPQGPLETLSRLALTMPLSPELLQLAREVLSPEPEQRPPNARVLLERLRALPESHLWSVGATPGPRETPGTLTQSPVSAEPPRTMTLSSENLQPLEFDEDEADTQQVGIESLASTAPPRVPAPVPAPAPAPVPAPAAAPVAEPGAKGGLGLKGLDLATIRVDRLPGLVPTPTAERPTAALPERSKKPPRPPEPVTQPLGDNKGGQVALPIQAEPTEKQPGGSAEDELPAQSTLVINNPAHAHRQTLPAADGGVDPSPGSVASAASKTVVDAPVVPKSASVVATMVSSRPHSATVTSGMAPTMPVGQTASSASQQDLLPSRLTRIWAFLVSPTAVGPVALVLVGCALLGLLLSAAVGYVLRHTAH